MSERSQQPDRGMPRLLAENPNLCPQSQGGQEESTSPTQDLSYSSLTAINLIRDLTSQIRNVLNCVRVEDFVDSQGQEGQGESTNPTQDLVSSLSAVVDIIRGQTLEILETLDRIREKPTVLEKFVSIQRQSDSLLNDLSSLSSQAPPRGANQESLPVEFVLSEDRQKLNEAIKEVYQTNKRILADLAPLRETTKALCARVNSQLENIDPSEEVPRILRTINAIREPSPLDITNCDQVQAPPSQVD